MSRRAKIARRLVPVLMLLIGGLLAGTAVAVSPGDGAKPASHVTIATRTAAPAKPQHVQISSQTETETQNVNTQITAAAQMIAATNVHEESWLFPVVTASADESSAASDSATEEPPPIDEPTPIEEPSVTGPTGPSGAPGESPDDVDNDGCSDSYEGACVDPYSGADDVNCDDIPDTDFDSVADDPYRLDADADGVACES